MPYPYSENSKAHLSTTHPLIQAVFNEASNHRDITIIDGRRDIEEQKIYFANGASQTMDSKHLPPEDQPEALVNAVDAAPYPIDWENHEELLMFGGFIMGIAATMGVPLRWGGDWDGDGNPRNNGDFDDLVHFELWF